MTTQETGRNPVETEATPRPWFYWHGDDSYAMNCYGITSESCDHEYVDDEDHPKHTVALTLLQQPRYASVDEDWAANTRLVVEAVNSYDRLRAVEAAARAVVAGPPRLREWSSITALREALQVQENRHG